MAVPAAPHRVGVIGHPAGAVEAVDRAGAAAESGRQGRGRYALLVVQIIEAADDQRPGEIAARVRCQLQALRQLGLLGVPDAVGEGTGADVVIVAADVAVAAIDRIAAAIAQIALDAGMVVLAEQACGIGERGAREIISQLQRGGVLHLMLKSGGADHRNGRAAAVAVVEGAGQHGAGAGGCGGPDQLGIAQGLGVTVQMVGRQAPRETAGAIADPRRQLDRHRRAAGAVLTEIL